MLIEDSCYFVISFGKFIIFINCSFPQKYGQYNSSPNVDKSSENPPKKAENLNLILLIVKQWLILFRNLLRTFGRVEFCIYFAVISAFCLNFMAICPICPINHEISASLQKQTVNYKKIEKGWLMNSKPQIVHNCHKMSHSVRGCFQIP